MTQLKNGQRGPLLYKKEGIDPIRKLLIVASTQQKRKSLAQLKVDNGVLYLIKMGVWGPIVKLLVGSPTQQNHFELTGFVKSFSTDCIAKLFSLS